MDSLDRRRGERPLGADIRLLLDVSRALSREPDLDALFARLHEVISRRMDATVFYVALPSAMKNHIDFAYYLDAGVVYPETPAAPIAGTLSGSVFRSGQAVLIKEYDEFERAGARRMPVGRTRSQSAIVAPMFVGDRVVGAISVQSPQSNAYDEDDLALMRAIGEQTAIAIENARHLQEIQEQQQELALLVEIARGLASDEFVLEQMCRRIRAHLETVLDVHVFYVALLDSDRGVLHTEYFYEEGRDATVDDYDAASSLAGSVLLSKSPLVIHDAANELTDHPFTHRGDPAVTIRSIVMVPLMVDDRPIGVVSVQSRRAKAFDAAAVRMLVMVAQHLALAARNVQLYRATEERVDRDALTDLYNRGYGMRRLNEEFERARRRGSRLCVMMLDLDNFKAINDTFGHPTGDRVLRSVSRALQQACRTSDVVCRYGGDEFLAIMPDQEAAHCDTIAERVRNEVGAIQETASDGALITPIASLGIACSHRDTPSAAELIDEADRALYRDKLRRSNG